MCNHIFKANLKNIACPYKYLKRLLVIQLNDHINLFNLSSALKNKIGFQLTRQLIYNK